MKAGRPANKEREQKVLKMYLEEGKSKYEIHKETGIPISTLYKIINVKYQCSRDESVEQDKRKFKNYTKEQKEKVIYLHRQGLKTKDIQKEVPIEARFIRYIIANSKKVIIPQSIIPEEGISNSHDKETA
jgi:hypothetical protein